MCRWGYFVLHGNERVLGDDLREELTTAQVPTQWNDVANYGLGMFVWDEFPLTGDPFMAEEYHPMQVWEMALTLFAVNNGFFSDIDVKKALAAERSMRDYIKSKFADLIKRVEEKNDLSADDEKALKDAIADWKKNGSY